MTDEFRAAHTDELAAVFDLRARAFQHGTVSDWAASVEQDPWWDDGADLVALSGGRIVATLRLVARRLAGVDGELRLAGFGDVASDPAVRGQGYIRRLLARAHERNRSAGYDLAMLFTTQPWVYGGSGGFSILPTPWLDLELQRLPTPAGNQWAIEPAEPVRHLPAIRHVYEQFGQGRLGYPVRGDAYWTHAARRSDRTWMRVALDHDERVAAYARVRLGSDGRAFVEEFPYLLEEAASALAAHLAQDPALAQYMTLGGRLPRDHVLGRAGQWRMRDDTMVHPYTAAGARLVQALREPTDEHSVYWSADGF